MHEKKIFAVRLQPFHLLCRRCLNFLHQMAPVLFKIQNQIQQIAQIL